MRRVRAVAHRPLGNKSRFSTVITLALRQSGLVLHTCETWPDVFALDYPIAAVGLWNGFVWVRTRAFGDHDRAVELLGPNYRDCVVSSATVRAD